TWNGVEHPPQRIKKLPERGPQGLGDEVHGRGKVAEWRKSLNRASTWRARAETARGHRPTIARWRRQCDRQESRAATPIPGPGDRSARRRTAANRVVPRGWRRAQA